MQVWAFTFLIIAVIAGILGYSGIADVTTAPLAKTLAWLFLAFFVLALAIHILFERSERSRDRDRPPP